jgi:hypothetical protein
MLEVSECGMTVDELKEKYNELQPGDHWSEHPEFTHQDWAAEASELNTLAGYWDWCISQIEQHFNDIEEKAKEK